MIEPVSAESLRKTGIFADKAGDFRQFPPRDWRDRESGDEIECAKSRDFRPIRAVQVGNLAERRNGWLGREGSNLRMAESKSAALPLGYAPTGRNEGRIDPLDRLRQRRSIEGVAPFQQPDGRISVQNQASWRYPLCWVISLDAPRAVFVPSGPPNTAIGELRPPRFRGKTAAADFRKSEISS